LGIFFFSFCRPYYIYIYPRHATDTCVDTQRTEKSCVNTCRYMFVHRVIVSTHVSVTCPIDMGTAAGVTIGGIGGAIATLYRFREK
jgi:hypothetical protein